MALTSGATHTLQWPVQWAARPRGGANPTKAGLSSDCRLQLACMKSELLVTAGQQTAVTTFSVLVHPARRVMKVGYACRRWPNPLGTEATRALPATATEAYHGYRA